MALRVIFRVLIFFAVLIASLSLTCEKDREKREGVMSVALIMNPGGIKDKSYNASLWSGVQNAVMDLNVELEYNSPDTIEDGLKSINKAIEGGYDVVIIMPRALSTEAVDIIKHNPETVFITIDSPLNLANVVDIKFDNYQAGYLAGFIASIISKSETIGFIGADKTQMTTELYKGYINGAKRDNETVKVMSEYLEDLDSLQNRKLIEEKVVSLTSQGVDVIFTPTGIASLTVFEVVAKHNKLAIGFDANQDYYEEGFIVTSVVRRLDLAIYGVLQDVLKSGVEKREYIFDLEDDFIDYSVDNFSDLFLTEEIKMRIEKVKEELKSEKVT